MSYDFDSDLIRFQSVAIFDLLGKCVAVARTG
jgi:hypothetical protein